jgi:hypothetical protein
LNRRRWLAWPRRAYLRHRIKAAEFDAALHDWHAHREPVLAAVARARIAELRAELAVLNLKGPK